MVLAPTDSYGPQNVNSNGNGGYGAGMRMSNGFFRPQMAITTPGWQDMSVAQPIDPKAILQYAGLGATLGTFTRSTNILQSAWGASPLVYIGANTKVVSYDITDAATTTDALQWTFNHQMVNVGANIPSALNKIAYLRAGAIWDNQVEINFGASTYNNVQLTVRDNLATSGQFLNSATGSVPVISFGSGITGNQVLHVSLLRPGVYSMVLAMVTGGVWSVFEMEWIVIK
ncbi:MAG: hypothetical protein WCH46_10870 [bacterium]